MNVQHILKTEVDIFSERSTEILKEGVSREKKKGAAPIYSVGEIRCRSPQTTGTDHLDVMDRRPP